MKPMLLCIGFDAGTAMRLSLISLALGADFRPVGESEYGVPLGALCGEHMPPQTLPSLPVNERMLVMARFTDAQTDALLKALRDLPPIPLKAVLTETNKRWNSGMLCAALCAEREKIQNGA